MRAEDLFRIELMEDLRARRALVLKFTLPAVLVLPLAIRGIPEQVKLAALPLVVLFVGVLGSSVGLTRLKEQGLVERLAALPQSRRDTIWHYLLANSFMDLAQMALPTAIALAALGPAAIYAAVTIACVVLSAFFSNSLGIIVSAASRSSGEVHLYSIVCVLLVGGAAGLFSGVGGGAHAVGQLAAALPFGLMVEGLSAEPAHWTVVGLIVSTLTTLIIASLALVASSRIFRTAS